MSFVRTVLRDIAPQELGVCYAHEHVLIGASYMTQLLPELRIDSIDRACDELMAVHAAGGRAVIDALPCDTGRDVRALAGVSRQTGVHVIAATGLHLQKYYTEGHWRFRLDPDALAAIFVNEIEHGIDANDRGGPDVVPTPHRAGVIKVAGGIDWAHERVIFEAACEAHRRSGAPILTHTEPLSGLQQVEFFALAGVDPSHVTLSHTDRDADPGYHHDLLESGVRLVYDRAFREQGQTLDLLTRFLPEYPSQLMLGTDAARASYWRSYGGAPGLPSLLTDFRQAALARGLGEAHLHRAFVTNPAAAFAFDRTGAS